MAKSKQSLGPNCVLGVRQVVYIHDPGLRASFSDRSVFLPFSHALYQNSLSQLAILP